MKAKIKINIGTILALSLCIALLFSDDQIYRYIGVSGIIYLSL
jgi:hypothetical protein